MWEHVMAHLENDPLKLGTEVDWVIKYHLHRGVPRASRPPAHAPARRAARPRVPRRHAGRGRSTTCSSGAARWSAPRPTTDIETAVEHAAADHACPPARRVHQAGQGAQARLHGRLGAPEAQRPGPAHRAVQGPVQGRATSASSALIASSVHAAAVRHAVVPHREVLRLLEERPGLQRVEVDLGDGPERAYVLTQLTGTVGAGDRVVVNTTAVELGLGTGGWHVVHWNLARDELERAGARPHHQGPVHEPPGRRRQHRGAPRRSWPRSSRSTGMPVVAAALHSQLPAVAVAVKERAPDARVAYVMTDGAGLAARALRPGRRPSRRASWSTPPSRAGTRSAATSRRCRSSRALAVARHVARADVAVVAMGPGHRRHQHPARLQRAWRSGRSSTPRSRSAGVPIAVPAGVVRGPAGAPPGLSHHSATALRLACRERVRVAGPVLGGDEEERLRAELVAAGIDRRHDLVEVGRPTCSPCSTRTGSHRLDGSAGGRGPGAVPGGRRRRRRSRPTALTASGRGRELTGWSGCSTSLATLLDTRRPLTPRRAGASGSSRLPGRQGRRAGAQFERDKETLRGLGHPDRASSRSTPRGRDRATGSARTSTTCPTSELTAGGARRAPRRGHRGAPRAAATRGRALRKLGGLEGAGARRRWPAARRRRPRSPRCSTPSRRRRRVTFAYRGETRHARAVGRRAPARPLVRRRSRPRPGRDPRVPRRPHRRRRRGRAAGAFEPPPDVDPDAVLARRPAGVRRRAAGRRPAARRRGHAAGWSSTQLGEEAVVERGDDGAVVVELSVVNRDAFRTFVLGLLEHAEVLGPPELRDDVRRRGSRRSPASRRHVEPASPRRGAAAPARCSRSCRGSLAHPGTTHRRARATRFEVDERELERDLELLPMCGLPPYTADRLIDVWVADDGACDDPPRRVLRAAAAPHAGRGVALLAAGRALLAVPGCRRARPARDRARQARGRAGRAGGARRGRRRTPAHLARSATAVEPTREQVEIDYYSFGRDEMTTRRIDPGARLPRVRRVVLGGVLPPRRGRAPLPRRPRPRRCAPTGEHVEPTGRPATTTIAELVYHPAPDDLRVTLRLAPDAAWVVESYPTESVDASATGGRVEVVLAVSEPRSSSGCCCGSGPAARVLATAGGREPVAAGRRRTRLARPACEDARRELPPERRRATPASSDDRPSSPRS